MAFKHTSPTRQKVKTIAILFSLVGLLLFPALKLKAQNPPVPDWVLAKSKIHGRPFLKKTVGAEARQQKFDALYYGLHFKIDFLHRQIWASAREHFASLQNNLTAITLDFNNKQLTIDSIAGAAVSYTRNGSFLDITLDRPYQKGDTFNVTIYYSGNPEKPDTISFKFDYTLDEEPYVWTLSEPYGARDWWPCKDTPADKADSADIFVTVPEGNVVASTALFLQSLQQIAMPGLQRNRGRFLLGLGIPIVRIGVAFDGGDPARVRRIFAMAQIQDAFVVRRQPEVIITCLRRHQNGRQSAPVVWAQIGRTKCRENARTRRRLAIGLMTGQITDPIAGNPGPDFLQNTTITSAGHGHHPAGTQKDHPGTQRGHKHGCASHERYSSLH